MGSDYGGLEIYVCAISETKVEFHRKRTMSPLYKHLSEQLHFNKGHQAHLKNIAEYALHTRTH